MRIGLLFRVHESLQIAAGRSEVVTSERNSVIASAEVL